MLTITIPAKEQWDELKEEFIPLTKPVRLDMEHSLVSLSKWESKWCKPFLSTKNKTHEQTLDYIACMTMTQNVEPDVFRLLTSFNIQQVNDYIDKPMTATTITQIQSRKSREIITAEIIYYWMVALSIPFECQKWHLNRLLTLVNVCNIKNNPKTGKMNQKEVMRNNTSLNAQRRAALGSKG